MDNQNRPSNQSSNADMIAKYFIYRNNIDQKGLTNKKLQKLLYYSQAWSLVLREKKIFAEDIEAWIHGPAIPSIYEKYKVYGFSDINTKIDRTELEDLTEDDIKLLESVWEIYGKYDGDYLEVLTHSELPWQEARKGTEPYESSKSVISVDTMKQYYGEKIKKK